MLSNQSNLNKIDFQLNEVMNYLASMKKLDVEVKKEPDKTILFQVFLYN
jgi:hypothetical protein